MDILYEDIHFPRKPYSDNKVVYIIYGGQEWHALDDDAKAEIAWEDFLAKHPGIVRKEDSTCWADNTAVLSHGDEQCPDWHFVVTYPYLD